MTSQKKETPVKPISETGKNEVESLKAQIENLKKQLEQQPETLEQKIQYYQEKQKKIKQLEKLDGFAESIVKVGQDIQEEAEKDDFFSERFAVRISRKTASYRDEMEDILKIQNPVLVTEVLGYCLERINSKRDILKNAINA